MTLLPPNDPTFSYSGECAICGFYGEFIRGELESIRESFHCKNCHSSLRYRDQAAVIIDQFSSGEASSLKGLVDSGRLNNLAIYEVALRSPFAGYFQALPGYVRSYLWDDCELGRAYENGVLCEDLTNLSFKDNTFNLVITSDVLEHIPDYERAFSEILRVLKVGGSHIFSLPTDFPMPPISEKRTIKTDDGEVHLKSPRYHNSGNGSDCLMYTDFGSDLPQIIDHGYSITKIVRRSMVGNCHENASFFTQKISYEVKFDQSLSDVSQSRNQVASLCPICGNDIFLDFNGRKNARCKKCLCMERNRLMSMFLNKFKLYQNDQTVLHFAPEFGLAKKFVELSGDLYYPCDLEPEKYKSRFYQTQFIDLSKSLIQFEDNYFDLIIHNHVLEHVPHDVGLIFSELNRILKPGGMHFFSIPISGEWTRENLSKDIDDSYRQKNFGQHDHVRIFGWKSMRDLLQSICTNYDGLPLRPIQHFTSEELERACIPRVAWDGVSGHSVYGYQKPFLVAEVNRS
jgi:ubiquinone/menaquinone biosynthesis C-methylase UbiE